MTCHARTLTERAAVAVSLIVCVPVKPVSNNWLSLLNFIVCFLSHSRQMSGLPRLG
jgi:hypothetical protein